MNGLVHIVGCIDPSPGKDEDALEVASLTEGGYARLHQCCPRWNRHKSRSYATHSETPPGPEPFVTCNAEIGEGKTVSKGFV